MLKIEKDFQKLMNQIKSISEINLREKIKSSYINLSDPTKKSIEDFFNTFPYWGNLNPQEENFQEIENKAHILKYYENDWSLLFNELADYRSKYTLYAILNNWYCYDFANLDNVRERIFPHYFDLEIIPECKEEVFVDLGAYTGDTIRDFISQYGEDGYQKIYAYEMSPESIQVLKNNTQIFKNIIIKEKAVSSISGYGHINTKESSLSANSLSLGEGGIEVITLDEDIKDKITILKMDIEGSEQKALIGAESHIKINSPKLIISVYHGFQELIEIWYKIKQINPNYKYYLRYYGGPIFPTEIVLYAISKK